MAYLPQALTDEVAGDLDWRGTESQKGRGNTRKGRAMGAFERSLIVALGCCLVGGLLALIGLMSSTDFGARRTWKNQVILTTGAVLLILGLMELWWILF